MAFSAKLVAFLALFLWASAFVAIRAGLHEFSPEGLALLRYLVASIVMGVIYIFIPNRSNIKWIDRLSMLALGAVGVGVYNLCLNYGELTVTSATASFIVGQSPIIIALFAVMSLGEKVPSYAILGFVVSMAGVLLIAFSEQDGFNLNIGFIYILLATMAGSFFTVMQKPFLQKYNAIQTTAYVVWGGTLFLLLFTSKLQSDLTHAGIVGLTAAVYLGVFPAAIGYVAWSYVLKRIPVSRAGSLLYLTPFMAMMLGWVYLHEVPVILTLMGGVLAMLGVWCVNHSYKKPVNLARHPEPVTTS